MSDLTTIMAEILAFRDDRQWKQFHTPKNLATALSVEIAELQEIFLWKDDTQIAELSENPHHRERVTHEIADVLIYALLFAASFEIDPAAAIREKLALNAVKYPPELARGNAKKYTEL